MGLIFWLIIYLMAYPFGRSFYRLFFWHFDDFSWGNTRMVVGEGKNKKVLADTEDVAFDPSLRCGMKMQTSQAGYGRRPESVGFSMASRPMNAMGMMGGGGPGSVMGGGTNARSTMYGMNLATPGSYNRSDSRSPSQRGSMRPNDFGGYQPGLNQHQSMLSLGGGHMSIFNGVGPPGGGNGSVRGSMMDFMGGGAPGTATPGLYMGGAGASMADMQHARNMSMFSMGGGIMPGNPSMMMGGGGMGTPSMMMMNPMGGGMMGGGNPSMMMGGGNPSMMMGYNADEIVNTLRIYLSQQDLMKITKRSVREALNEWFPNANLNEKKPFINAQIDKILAGNS
ncbi:hypothetical protein KEM48_013615 [Puccinia striiformis f. sp. tritici PST-130]|nr:hypothetical protein KEM48_013615 [Puccinia striiformis f. sp. tritici PST-130]